MEEVASQKKKTFIVASGGYETQVRIFDDQMRLFRSLQFPDMQVLHIAFSGRGPARLGERILLAVAGSPKIGVYDISTDAVAEIPFYMYSMHQAAVTAVGFEPCSSEFLYSSSEDGTLQVWVPAAPPANGALQQGNNAAHHGMHGHPPASNATLRTFRNRGPSNLVPINDVVYYPPKMLYFAIDAIGRLRIWDHNKKQNEGLRSEFKPHRSGRHLQCIDLSWDHKIVVMANLDGFVFIYRVTDLLLEKSPLPAIIRPSESYVPRVRLSQAANLLVCPLTKSGIKIFRMRDIVLGQDQGGVLQEVAPVQQFGDRPGWIWDVSFIGASEDHLVACSSNTQIMLWNLKNMAESAEFPPSMKAVICVAVKEIILDDPVAEQSRSGAAGFGAGHATGPNWGAAA